MAELYAKYEIKEELGRGAFSLVKLGIDRKTGSKVAVKIIEKKNVDGNYQKNVHNETDILKRINHPAIIKLIEMFETDEFLFLVMELTTGGELFDRIVAKGCYFEDEAVELVRRIVDAIKYLHDNGICHRDLKPENLLLGSAEDDVDVRIADFGLSKIISKKMMMQTACGTPGYVAPEVLNATGYDKEVDMWSIGVITYILLCGFPPFYGNPMPKLFEQILSGSFDYPADYWEHVSDDAIDFINHLLVVDRKERFTADQALAHPWLSRGKPKSKNELKIGAALAKHVQTHKADSQNSLKTSGSSGGGDY